MKKILLTTTALGLLSATSAFAAAPTVTVGGYADFQVGIADNESFFESNATVSTDDIHSRDVHSRIESEIHFKVDATSDNGLNYGAHIEINANPNGNDDNGTEGDNAERAFIYAGSGFGRVELGANGSVTKSLKVDASTFARATGGIGGDFYKYADLSAQDYVIVPELSTDGGLGGIAQSNQRDTVATANKINYYSPVISGFQFGASYTSDIEERGTSLNSENNDGTENIFNLGLKYSGEVSGVGIEASVVGEIGDAETTGEDPDAVAVGLAATFEGFTLGGSYEDGTDNNDIDVQKWTVGAAYEHGAFAASIGYLYSEAEEATDIEFENLSIGADYQLAPGLVPYVEVSFFDTDSNGADAEDNDGTVVIIGTELTF